MSLNSFAIKCIKKYQQNKELIGSGRCKHYPTCSNYAIGCYEKFNFFKASFLTLFRIIRCNPLTKKVYDPVPLNSKEKKELKKRRKELIVFMTYLKKTYLNHPLMEIDDYITLIYESSFGPYYLKDKITSIDDLKQYLQFNPKYKEDSIDSRYVRIYPTTLTDDDYHFIFEEITSSTMTDLQMQMFHEKLYLFKQMVKKKDINLNYKEVFEYIENYLIGGIRYVGHSEKYKENYSINYFVTKSQTN